MSKLKIAKDVAIYIYNTVVYPLTARGRKGKRRKRFLDSSDFISSGKGKGMERKACGRNWLGSSVLCVCVCV